MALRIKRGTNAERLSYTPELGELIYVTDYSSAGVGPLWVGDGSTAGGNEASGSGGGGGGITDIVGDTTPQLGGNLDLNSYDITGTGDIDTTGNINATGSIDVNLNIDAGGYVNATTMAANLFNGTFDGDLSGSVFGDDSTLIVDGNNNTINASSATIGNLSFDSTGNITSSGNTVYNVLQAFDLKATNPNTNFNLKVKGNNDVSKLFLMKTATSDISATYYESAIFGGRDDTNGEYFHNTIAFGTDKTLICTSSNGNFDIESEYLTHTNTGRLGIGTYTPAATLDVAGGGLFSGQVQATAFKGTFVADDSTILVDGVAGKVNLAPNDITDLGNVTIATPQAGQVLKYNGSAWVNDVDVAGSGGGGGIGNIGVGADDSTVRLINSGESFLIKGAGTITTASDAEGNITVTGTTEVSSDTTPVLGGNMDSGGFNLKFGDSGIPGTDDTLVFGAGDDLQIYHTGTASVISDNGDGGIQILTNLLEVKNAANNEIQIDATEDAGVRLYYNGSSKLQTTTNGITITGAITGNLTGDVTGNVSGTAGGVAWSGVTSTPTTLSGYGITDDVVIGTELGNFTFTASVLDSNDSGAITVTPSTVFSSDVTVENDLIVTNKVVADRFESTSTGTPEITAATNLNLTAGNAVVITQSPVRFATFTTAERDALASQNGDMLYNTTTNKFQGYANGAWVDLH